METLMRSSGMPVEEHLHVRDRIHRHAGLAHVSEGARMIAVVAAVGGQIEGHRQALLAGGDVAPVEGVGLLGRGEAGVLADGPGPGHVHRGVRAAHEGREAGQRFEVLAALEVLGRVERVDVELLERVPDGVLGRLAGLGQELGGPLFVGHRRGRGVEGDLREVGKGFHAVRPRAW
jgi:hypothetical protein